MGAGRGKGGRRWIPALGRNDGGEVVDVADAYMSPVFGEGRRFRYVTDDEDRKKRLDELICRKKLSRRDLGLILRTISLNLDIFLPYEK